MNTLPIRAAQQTDKLRLLQEKTGGTVKKRKEIKFREDREGLIGRQNGIIFRIYEIPTVDKIAPYIVSARSAVVPGIGLTTSGHRYFSLDEAKEFCQQIAAGEIKLEELQATYDAENDAKERAVFQEIAEKAKEFQKCLDAKGLKYTDLLELEVLAHSLGDMGHNILLGYERGEGWPNGT